MGVLSSVISGFNASQRQNRLFEENERIRQAEIAQDQALMARLRGAHEQNMPRILENNPAINPEGLNTRQLSNQRGMRDNQIRRALRTNFDTRELASQWGQKNMFRPQLAAPTVYEGRNDRFVYNPNEDTNRPLNTGVPRKGKGQTINVHNITGRANKQQEAVDAYYGDQYTANLEKATVLEDRLATTKSIANNLDGLYTGTGGELLTEAMGLAKLGQLLTKEQEAALGKRENAQKMVKDLVIQFKMPEFKGAMSDADRDFMIATINDETTSPIGLKMGVLSMQEQSDYAKKLVTSQRDYRAKNKVLDDRYTPPPRGVLSFKTIKGKFYAIRTEPGKEPQYKEIN